MTKQDELANLLISNNLLTQAQYDEIRNSSEFNGENLENILLDKSLLDSEKLTELKAQAGNLSYKNLFGLKIDDQALNVIPLRVAENYRIICFEKSQSKIAVGLTDVDDFKAREAVDFLAKEQNFKVEYYLISQVSFDYAFKYYRTLSKEVTTALESKAEEEAEELPKVSKKKEEEAEEITQSAPVSKIVSVIIRHAVEGRASDIHIEPSRKESRVRYRIDGILHTSLILPKSVHNAITMRVKVLADLKLDETRIPQDGRIRISINDKEIDLRISVLPLMGEEKVVMRILDITRGAPTLEELGFMGPQLDIIKKNVEKTNGLFLITGPTGSGKSTTLFAALNIINQESINIVTLEDPVEYFIQGVNQSQIRPEIGFTFASGLRSLLRQDPDVIMVGEIRDNETAELCIHAGLTGHFVLSTLHTNDAMGSIPRLFDMKVEPFLLGSTLNVIISQRLCRKICPHCRKEQKIPPDILNGVIEELNKIPPAALKQMSPNINLKNLKFYKGAGCARCGSTGYMGRLAITEVIDVNQKLREIIIDMDKILTVEDVKKNQEFVTIKQDGIIKALLGLTTMEEIINTTYN